MRIAYITLHWPRTNSSSIGKKITRQIKEWRSFGHSVKFFSHLHEIKEKSELIEGNKYFYPNHSGFFARETGRILAAKKLIQDIADYSPDLIYLRWGMYVFPMWKLFNIAPTVVEINTNDKKEHKLLGIFLDFYNRITRSIFLKKAKGLIFTSNELVDDPAFRKYVNSFQVIANGIDLSSIPFYEPPNNDPPRMIFLGTPGMAWHGLEKLEHFASENQDIMIDIIGPVSSTKSGETPPNLVFHGYLQGEQFEAVLKYADAAIGSISLHINEMNEASPFKIRDCAGRGIPCILPYIDTDLTGLDCEEILQISNAPDNILKNGQVIHDFIFAMRGKRLDRKIIRDKIDLGKKEKNRVAFFERILSVSKR